MYMYDIEQYYWKCRSLIIDLVLKSEKQGEKLPNVQEIHELKSPISVDMIKDRMMVEVVDKGEGSMICGPSLRTFNKSV